MNKFLLVAVSVLVIVSTFEQSIGAVAGLGGTASISTNHGIKRYVFTIVFTKE
jgi:hypothetical protein